jgi:hypothetical protein
LKVHWDGRLVRVRHLLEKNGSYYFNPSSLMRKRGYTARAFGTNLAVAIEATEAYNLDWDRRRDKAINRKKLDAFNERYEAAREGGSVVYFIEAGGRIKVGTSRKLFERIRDMQIGSPVPLSLIGYIVGDRTLEASLHVELQPYRAHGEWFSDVPQVRHVIQRYLA